MSSFMIPDLRGQAPPAPAKDVLLFKDGEKLIGQFERSTGSSVTFKSDMAGEITVDWSKIAELHSAQKFAVITKDVKPRRGVATAQIPQGSLSMSDQKLEIAPANNAPPTTVPVGNAAYVIDQQTFQKDMFSNPNIFEDWKGAVNGGVSLVEATQNSQTFTGALNLVRLIPTSDWLSPNNRTLIDFSASYGKITQPGTPSVKTEILHADIERDQYFNPRVYAFGTAAFDHNFSQGLDLQQTYGVGIGWIALRNANQELDLKASADYIKQSFVQSSSDQNLFGSTFAESFNRKFGRGIVLNEGISITPSWNVLNAYSAAGNVSLTLPLYKRFNSTLSTIDTFLNNPPPGFKKNSLQFTAGFGYTLP